MKLQTKFQDEDFEMGEVVDAEVASLPLPAEHEIKVTAKAKSGGEHTFYYDSITELNEDWEDYEEPKEYYYIDGNGLVCCKRLVDVNNTATIKEIGNHFETKEEAEQAVKKLKAWKRLKDAGVRFDMSRLATPDTITIFARVSKRGFQEDAADLAIIFGGGK